MYSFYVDAESGREPYLHIYDRDENEIKSFSNSRYIILYDGILYNEDEVRKWLTEAGYSFVFDVTEEVVAYAYDLWYKKCLLRLDGDFLFVIWDDERKELFFARDVYGIRPMFYRRGHNCIMLFSEKRYGENITELASGCYGIFSQYGLKTHSYKNEYMCEAFDILYDIMLTTDAPLVEYMKKEKLGELIKDAENGSITASRIILHLIRLNCLMEKYNADIL